MLDVTDNWWLRHLNLTSHDHQCLRDGIDLSDVVINSAQGLLKQQFPNMFGFQNTLLGEKLKFKPFCSTASSVQILHTGNKWEFPLKRYLIY